MFLFVVREPGLRADGLQPATDGELWGGGGDFWEEARPQNLLSRRCVHGDRRQLTVSPEEAKQSVSHGAHSPAICKSTGDAYSS
jgi:hypothetical protein